MSYYPTPEELYPNQTDYDNPKGVVRWEIKVEDLDGTAVQREIYHLKHDHHYYGRHDGWRKMWSDARCKRLEECQAWHETLRQRMQEKKIAAWYATNRSKPIEKRVTTIDDIKVQLQYIYNNLGLARHGIDQKLFNLIDDLEMLW